VLNALKNKLDRFTLEKLYNSYVRSKLEYGNIIWDNCTKQQSDLLESIHYRAAKIVSGAIHRTSHNIVFNELGWDSLGERRHKQRLKVFFKMGKSEAPQYLNDLIPATQERYDFRHDNYPTQYGRTSSFRNSFIPRTIRDWNALDDETKGCDTVEYFTQRLNAHLNKPPIWYFSGDRRHNMIHARLRMLCSSLNDHLYSFIHVVDSPACLCGNHRENNKHYFLECPLYFIERNVMFAQLTLLNFHPTLSNLLFGDASQSDEINKKAFLIIQDYIMTTRRFD
jgi:hypothetical protein